MEITIIILPGHVSRLLFQEAKESIKQGKERGVVLMAEKDGSILRAVKAISHSELEQLGLVLVKILDTPSWDSYMVSTYFDYRGIEERYASKLKPEQVFLFAHSHHPDFLEPSLADESASLSDGSAICFSAKDGQLIIFGMYGKQRIPVKW